jgi:hypothetical protein
MMDPLWRKHNYNNGEIFTQDVQTIKTPLSSSSKKILVYGGQGMLWSRNFPWRRGGVVKNELAALAGISL